MAFSPNVYDPSYQGLFSQTQVDPSIGGQDQHWVDWQGRTVNVDANGNVTGYVIPGANSTFDDQGNLATYGSPDTTGNYGTPETLSGLSPYISGGNKFTGDTAGYYGEYSGVDPTTGQTEYWVPDSMRSPSGNGDINQFSPFSTGTGIVDIDNANPPPNPALAMQLAYGPNGQLGFMDANPFASTHDPFSVGNTSAAQIGQALVGGAALSAGDAASAASSGSAANQSPLQLAAKNSGTMSDVTPQMVNNADLQNINTPLGQIPAGASGAAPAASGLSGAFTSANPADLSGGLTADQAASQGAMDVSSTSAGPGNVYSATGNVAGNIGPAASLTAPTGGAAGTGSLGAWLSDPLGQLSALPADKAVLLGLGLGNTVISAINSKNAANNRNALNQQVLAQQAARQQQIDNPLGQPLTTGASLPSIQPRGQLNTAGLPTTPEGWAHWGESPQPQFFTHQAKGGLPDSSMAQPVHNSSMQPPFVQGLGGGQSDKVPALLSPKEYVMDADSVSALGDGNPDEGARKLDDMRKKIRAHKRSAPVTKIPPKAKKPEKYLGVV